LARLFQANLKMGTRLTVIPMRNWRRQMWFDDTDLPWVRPSPNMPNITTALLYPALVPFEASNVSVGRGTEQPFQRFGAPWLKADSVARLLEDLSLTGVKFRAERFTPDKPGDNKFAGRSIPGVRLEVIDRERVQPARIGAAILPIPSSSPCRGSICAWGRPRSGKRSWAAPTPMRCWIASCRQLLPSRRTQDASISTVDCL
jgi:uncharacterized protein YbbC (DUF1343 family)